MDRFIVNDCEYNDPAEVSRLFGEKVLVRAEELFEKKEVAKFHEGVVQALKERHNNWLQESLILINSRITT